MRDVALELDDLFRRGITRILESDAPDVESI